jgi:excinuclease ABC subunit C
VSRHASEFAAPEATGVYLMRDASGRLLYIGKAVNLKARLNQYLHLHDTREMVPRLVSELSDVEFIVTNSEKEALLVERQLVRKLKPPYNIMLRDDKAFLMVRVSQEEPFPRLELVRKRRKDAALYFGPFSSAAPIREYVRFLSRAFQLRTCSENVFRQRQRACVLHQMGWCSAPCVDKDQEAHYRERMNAAVDLLTRRRADAAGLIEKTMERASDDERFEEAARYRDLLQAMRQMWDRQRAHIHTVTDADVFGRHVGAVGGALYVLHVRDGLLSGTRGHFHEGLAVEGSEMDALICRFYGDVDPPDLVLADLPEEEAGVVAQILTEQAGRPVRVVVPVRGEKRGLVDMAHSNASQLYEKEHRLAQSRFELLDALASAVGLPERPQVVECVDISVFQGSDAVGAVSVAVDGVLAPKEYRTFHVRGETLSDFEMMREVVARRLGQVRDDIRPRLVLIDGGRAHLATVLPLFEARETRGESPEAGGLPRPVLHVAAIAKARPEQGLDTDRVYLPRRRDALDLATDSPVLRFIMQLRDEAHRFGVAFHRKKRKKRTLVSPLLSVPGMGRKRRLVLLRHFGSYEAAEAASLKDLLKVPGLPDPVARALHQFFHRPEAG